MIYIDWVSVFAGGPTVLSMCDKWSMRESKKGKMWKGTIAIFHKNCILMWFMQKIAIWKTVLVQCLKKNKKIAIFCDFSWFFAISREKTELA